MPHYRVIANPASGRGAGKLLIPHIEKSLRTHGLDFDLVETQRPWHAAELAYQAVGEGVDVVASAGGDGTANEVINGLVQAQQDGLGRAVMAVLPIGRGNDFGFSMGVPVDVDSGIEALRAGHVRRIDIGRVTGGDYPQGRYFGNGVGVGFDAVVGFEALKVPQISGFISYLFAALKTIFLYFKAPLVEVEADDIRVTQRSLMVSIMNGIRLGGGFYMAPHGRSDDGQFDVTVAREVGKLRIFGLIPRFMNGTQATHPAIRTGQARRVRVTALNGSNLPAHADGETVCVAGRELILEVLPSQLDLIVAPEWKKA